MNNKKSTVTNRLVPFLHKRKKGIGPVVATALLIVVSVVAVIGFQTWFGTYSSDLFIKTEKDSSSTSNTNIETLVGDQLYFKNNLDNLTIKQIKIGNKECNLSINLTKGVHNISLGDCINNLTTQVNDITVITDKKVYTKKHLFKDVKEVTTTLTPPAPLTNYFGDGSDGDIKVNSSGVYQNLGSGYQLHPNTTGTEWNSTEDGDMIVINAQDFLVESGVTFSTTKRCRGLMIYAQGNVTVDGTISMTARGAHANPANNTHIDTPVPPSDGNIVPVEGIVIRRQKSNWSDINSTIISNAHASSIDDFNGTHNSTNLFFGTGSDAVNSESNQINVTNGLVIKIPRVGGSGVAAFAGVNGQIPGGTKLFGLGGGGRARADTAAGASGDGTCFSGGAGGSGTSLGTCTSANNFGGAGGSGTVQGNAVSGGAGNPGGAALGNYPYAEKGEDGTGGLLIVIVRKNINISTSGKILSNGMNGGDGYGASGGSGGGVITLLYGASFLYSGLVEVNGGIGGDTASINGPHNYGGSGGAGSIIGPIKIDS